MSPDRTTGPPNCPVQRTGGQRRFTAQRPSQRLVVVRLPQLSVGRSAAASDILSAKDREDLVEDARDRLIQWLALRQQEGEMDAQN
jgi:hypothetical protein